ncbi:GGDEF domain-containing protein, partial [Xanthomonas sp. Kuri4-3]
MRHRVSLGDLGVIAAVLSVLTYIAYAYDIFVTEGSTSAAGQTVELDEMLLIGATLLLGLLIFSIRRYREQKREARRRTQAEQRVRELAYQDPLTGLPNRR